MTLSNNYSAYTNINSAYSTHFRGQLQEGAKTFMKPVDKVENIVNNTVDAFVPESKDEETKKSHKTAIRVFSTTLVLSTFVALLNPKFSSKLLNRLKKTSANAGNKAQVEGSVKGTWNKIKQKTIDGALNLQQVLNNANSVKDEGFKWLCRKSVILRKPHDYITKGFDKLSKNTVFFKYNKTTKKMDKLDEILKLYKKKLNPEDQKLFENKLKEIDSLQSYFGKSNVENRLLNQEKLMANLEKDTISRMKIYGSGLWNKTKGIFTKNQGAEVDLKDAYHFWAEESLTKQRKIVETEGTNAVNALFGDGKGKKGAYNEIVEILSPRLNNNDKEVLDTCIKNAEKSLRSANKSECTEYFDKKRDLILGGAPTDIMTALFGLTAGGIAIGTADSKEERVSRVVTKVLPVIGGLGVSTALTAMLFSGGKGLIIGSAFSGIFSLLGSGINRFLLKPSAKNQVAKNKNESSAAESTV